MRDITLWYLGHRGAVGFKDYIDLVPRHYWFGDPLVHRRPKREVGGITPVDCVVDERINEPRVDCAVDKSKDCLHRAYLRDAANRLMTGDRPATGTGLKGSATQAPST